MAATGLLATLLWFSGAVVLIGTELLAESIGFVVAFGLIFVPFALVASFAIGTALWGTLYPTEDHQRYGALFGGLTSLCSLAAGAFGFALVVSISNIASGEIVASEAVAFAAFLFVAGFILAVIAAGWIVVPLGVVGGWYHERAKHGAKSASETT